MRSKGIQREAEHRMTALWRRLASGCRIIRTYSRGNQEERVLRMGKRSVGGVIVCEQPRPVGGGPVCCKQTGQNWHCLGLDTGETVMFVSSPEESGAGSSSGLLGLALLTDFMGNVVG